MTTTKSQLPIRDKERKNVPCGYEEVELDEIWLWTGESVFCRCAHHVEDHFTCCYRNLRLFHCYKWNECTGFVAYKVRPNTYVETNIEDSQSR